MAARRHRYRITVTPLASDGFPALDRCSFEFDHSCEEDWLRQIESVQGLRGFDSNERSALAIGTKLLNGVMCAHLGDTDDLFAPLRAGMSEFIAGLRRRNQP